MQPGRARTSRLGVPLPPRARWVGWVAAACPTHGVLVPSCPSAALCVHGVLGHLAPVHRCARSVRCVASAVSWATWLLFMGAPARCVALLVRCPGPLGSCSPVWPRGFLRCVCGVLGHLAPGHWCARSVCCVVCRVSWATWLCSPVCPLGVLLCVCGVLGHLAPVHRCAWPWCPVPLLSSVLVCVRCPGLGGACSPACALCAVRVCRWWLCLSSSPPNVFCLLVFFLFFFKINKKFKNLKKKGARLHCRHRHGQLVQWCNSVVFSGVCCRCFGGGRAPGVQVARPDVHWYASGWVWLGASLV